MNAYKAMATRVTNAENRFMEAVREQFNKTEVEAEVILTVFKQEKVVKLDIVTGQFSLVSGLFWDAQVMDNALAA